MPTHHTCHSCGHPLSHLRPIPDPHYNLPIITCPECRTAVVRRRDPGVQGFRTAWKTARAGVYTAIQIIMAALLMTASMALVTNTAYSARDQYQANPLAVLFLQPRLLRQDEVGPDLAILVVILLLVGIATGAWIRSALHHLNATATAAAFVLIPLSFPLQYALRYYLWLKLFNNPGTHYWGDAGIYAHTPDILTASAMHATFILAGFPLANSARNLWAAQQRARWSRRRRARRRLRDDR